MIGVSGALAYFAPAQPYLAFVGLALLVVSLLLRLRAHGSCALVADDPTVLSPTREVSADE